MGLLKATYLLAPGAETLHLAVIDFIYFARHFTSVYSAASILQAICTVCSTAMFQVSASLRIVKNQ